MNKLKKEKLVICTTVPDTLLYILNGQPKYLKKYFDVVIITSYSGYNRNFFELENVTVYNVAFKRDINLLYDIVALFQMILLLCKVKPQIIHSYTPKAGLISMVSAWILRIPIRIHTFTGLLFPYQIGFKKLLLIVIDRLICFCSTKIIPEGQGVKNDLISFGITNKRLDIIGNGNISGIDIVHFSTNSVDYTVSLEKLGICSDLICDKFVYCFIGRLNFDKGLSELYQAFVTLPENTFLLIAGDLDKEGNSIQIDLHTKMKNHSRIILLGFVSDVRLVLKLANVLVLPSYREGFPNVLLQSLSMNVPAIATNINGCNEIIIDNYNGWLVEPKSAKDLANKMSFVLKIDKNNFDKIKENSRESISSRFEQSEYRKLLVKMYKNLILNER